MSIRWSTYTAGDRNQDVSLITPPVYPGRGLKSTAAPSLHRVDEDAGYHPSPEDAAARGPERDAQEDEREEQDVSHTKEFSWPKG